MARVVVGRASAKVDLDVILRACVHGQSSERHARAGDDRASGRGKADHGRMADATAGSGQEQRAPRVLAGVA